MVGIPLLTVKAKPLHKEMSESKSAIQCFQERDKKAMQLDKNRD
jgi:hypothetical protein